jgi:hypothetical protein
MAFASEYLAGVAAAFPPFPQAALLEIWVFEPPTSWNNFLK